MRDRPGLASCAVHCRHCGIRFLTHPRNAHRQNLRCPFGCREHHRRQQANARSQKHYRTDEGRRNKKRLNGKRNGVRGDGENGRPPDTTPADDASPSDTPLESVRPPTPRPPRQPTQVDLQESSHDEVKLTLEGFTLDEATLANSPMLPYLATVASVLEGRTIHREELLAAMRKSMRQRSIGRRPRREYVLRFLHQHPP